MFAQAMATGSPVYAGYSIGQILIAVVVVAACVALVLVALRKFGLTVPDWFMQVVWICLAALVVIVGIKFVMSLW